MGLATAVGTMIWGYREWTTNTAAIKAAQEQAKLKADVNNLKAIHTPPHPTLHPTPPHPPATPVLEEPEKVKKGSIFDPSSSNHGRYVFAPLLFATGLGALGISIDQIVKATSN